MSDLVIDPLDVDWVSGVRPRTVQGGTAIERGEVLRQANNLRYVLADASNPASANAAGIAVSDGTEGGLLLLAGPGSTVDIGVETDEGVPYVLSSDTPGGIAPYDDLGDEDTPNFLFWGTGTTIVTLSCILSPVAIPVSG